jgi:hypothetical protein
MVGYRGGARRKKQSKLWAFAQRVTRRGPSTPNHATAPPTGARAPWRERRGGGIASPPCRARCAAATAVAQLSVHGNGDGSPRHLRLLWRAVCTPPAGSLRAGRSLTPSRTRVAGSAVGAPPPAADRQSSRTGTPPWLLAGQLFIGNPLCHFLCIIAARFFQAWDAIAAIGCSAPVPLRSPAHRQPIVRLGTCLDFGDIP